MRTIQNYGNGIGQLTNELLNDYGWEAYITEFVSIGPKSYSIGIKTHDERIVEVSKCKSFQCKGRDANILNFDNFKKIILIESRTSNIQRKNYFRIVTDVVKKKFSFTFDSRARCADHNTLAYGDDRIQ